LGVFGVQICAASGANAIGVISDESKRDYVLSLGAKGVINRKDFNCWGQLPTVNSPEYTDWTREARKFGKAIWDITGKKDVDIVFEHPGEQTFPVSSLVVKRGGMVVFCAGTTGFNITFDARYVWMRRSASRARTSPISSRRPPPTSSCGPAHRPMHERGVPLGEDPRGPHQDVEEPARAGQHGRARQRATRRLAHLRRRARSVVLK
jgi:NADPH:quinone reductase-like Zn-dependent oxidoreductase